MTARGQHLREMQYAMAHNVTLAEAKRRLARQRRIEAKEFLENLQNCGTRSVARTEPETILGRSLSGVSDQPWMMRD